MCMEDIRLGRKTISRFVTVNVDSTSILIVKGDPNRIALTFFPPPTNLYYVNSRKAAATGTGAPILSTAHELTLTIQDHGDAVRGEWYAIAPVAAVNVNYLETVLLEQ